MFLSCWFLCFFLLFVLLSFFFFFFFFFFAYLTLSLIYFFFQDTALRLLDFRFISDTNRSMLFFYGDVFFQRQCHGSALRQSLLDSLTSRLQLWTRKTVFLNSGIVLFGFVFFVVLFLYHFISVPIVQLEKLCSKLNSNPSFLKKIETDYYIISKTHYDTADAINFSSPFDTVISFLYQSCMLQIVIFSSVRFPYPVGNSSAVPYFKLIWE